nr:hypothetical protein [Tolypothrix sp. FACHB-123]
MKVAATFEDILCVASKKEIQLWKNIDLETIVENGGITPLKMNLLQIHILIFPLVDAHIGAKALRVKTLKFNSVDKG